MTEDRLGKILQRQAEEVAKRQRLADAAEEAKRAAFEREAAAKVAWGEMKATLMSALDALNKEIEQHHLAIYSWYGGTIGFAEIDKLTFGLTAQQPQGTLQRLDVRLMSSGRFHIQMGTTSRSPAKQYHFGLEEASEDKWRQVFIDFLDVNVPS